MTTPPAAPPPQPRRPQVPPPAAALPDGEPNRYLRGFKTSVCRGWSHTRSREVMRQCDLTFFLWALGREDDAVAVATSMTSVVTTPEHGGRQPNYPVWGPVAHLNALEARVHRLTDDPAAAAVPAARIVADCGLADNPEFIADQVPGARAAVARSGTDESRTWACRRLARTAGSLVLLGELAVAGHPFAAYYDAREVEETLVEVRGLLVTRLG